MTTLQMAVDEFARSLTLPTKLFTLHKGRSGDTAALNPAIVLLIISAFEGFAETFLATALLENGTSLGQVAHLVGDWRNPTLEDLQKRLNDNFPGTTGILQKATLPVLMPPTIGRTLHTVTDIPWPQAIRDSKAWMQVRHCLSHGVVSGWRTEQWPRSVNSVDLNGRERPILYTSKTGKKSVTLQGARSCSSVYVIGGQILADTMAVQFGTQLDWTGFLRFFEAASGVKGALTPIN